MDAFVNTRPSLTGQDIAKYKHVYVLSLILYQIFDITFKIVLQVRPIYQQGETITGLCSQTSYSCLNYRKLGINDLFKQDKCLFLFGHLHIFSSATFDNNVIYKNNVVILFSVNKHKRCYIFC